MKYDVKTVCANELEVVYEDGTTGYIRIEKGTIPKQCCESDCSTILFR